MTQNTNDPENTLLTPVVIPLVEKKLQSENIDPKIKRGVTKAILNGEFIDISELPDRLKVNVSDLVENNKGTGALNTETQKALLERFNKQEWLPPHVMYVKSINKDGEPVAVLKIKDGHNRSAAILKLLTQFGTEDKYKIIDSIGEDWISVINLTNSYVEDNEVVVSEKVYLPSVVNPTMGQREQIEKRMALHFIQGWAGIAGEDVAQNLIKPFAAFSILYNNFRNIPSVTDSNGRKTIDLEAFREKIKKQKFSDNLSYGQIERTKEALEILSTIMVDLNISPKQLLSAAYEVSFSNPDYIGGKDELKSNILNLLTSPEMTNMLSKSFPSEQIEPMREKFAEKLHIYLNLKAQTTTYRDKEQLISTISNFVSNPDMDYENADRILSNSDLELAYKQFVYGNNYNKLKKIYLINSINNRKGISKNPSNERELEYLINRESERIEGTIEEKLLRLLGYKSKEIKNSDEIMSIIASIREFKISYNNLELQIADITNREKRNELLSYSINPEILDKLSQKLKGSKDELIYKINSQNPETFQVGRVYEFNSILNSQLKEVRRTINDEIINNLIASNLAAYLPDTNLTLEKLKTTFGERILKYFNDAADKGVVEYQYNNTLLTEKSEIIEKLFKSLKEKINSFTLRIADSSTKYPELYTRLFNKQITLGAFLSEYTEKEKLSKMQPVQRIIPQTNIKSDTSVSQNNSTQNINNSGNITEQQPMGNNGISPKPLFRREPLPVSNIPQITPEQRRTSEVSAVMRRITDKTMEISTLIRLNNIKPEEYSEEFIRFIQYYNKRIQDQEI